MKSSKKPVYFDKQPAKISDTAREKMIAKMRPVGIMAATFLLILGLQDLFLAIINYELPHTIKNIQSTLFLAFILLVLWVSLKSIKYGLEPKDEYETIEIYRNRANAFNFLSTGVFFVIIFSEFPNKFILPILYILLGMAWLIENGVLKPKNAK